MPLLATVFLRYLAGRQSFNVSSMDYVMFGIYFWCAEVCLIFSAFYHLVQPYSHHVDLFWHGMDLLGIVIVCLDDGADHTFANIARVPRQNHGQVAQAVCVQALAGRSCSGPRARMQHMLGSASPRQRNVSPSAQRSHPNAAFPSTQRFVLCKEETPFRTCGIFLTTNPDYLASISLSPCFTEWSPRRKRL